MLNITLRSALARGAFAASLVAWPAALTAAATALTTPLAAAAPARTVTLTYLQAKPGQLAKLERFIRANWFAMDAIAVKQGLFVSYEWLDTGNDDGTWNAIVTVTYHDEKGFGGIEPRWAAIKSSHTEVRPDGLGLKELGRVVETKNLLERAPFTTKQPAATTFN